MHVTRIVFGLTTIGLVATFIGCGQTAAEPPAPPVPVAQADAEQDAPKGNQPVHFTDMKELQQGTGPVDKDVPEKFSDTKTGLKYRLLRKSDGKKPGPRDKVTVNYRGWFDSGEEFDGSYKDGQPVSFPLNRVVAGWTEGLQLVGEGGMIELWIPSKLGYGPRGKGTIPGNATLHFVVELIKVQQSG